MRRFFEQLKSGSGTTYVVLAGFALLAVYFLYPRARRESLAPGVTELVFWTPGSIADSMKAAVEEFERRNPQYRVVTGTATVRDAVGDPTRFLLGVAGGVPPDLIYFDRFAVVEWASRGAFTDLTDLYQRDRDQPYGIREENFVEPAWREPIYKGKIYAIANSIDTRALYYNSDSLIRAGLVYTADDPEVKSGSTKPGEARPPRTWEELCRKRLHARATAARDGVVTIDDYLRRPAVNEDTPAGAAVALDLAGVRVGDIAVLISGQEVFRGRIGEILGPRSFRIDMHREQRPGMNALPLTFTGGACDLKIFDQDCHMARLTRFDTETGALKSVAFIPLFGNSWLYMYGWLNGAQFMQNDGTECTLDSPEIVGALQYVVDMYDILGGASAANAFRVSTTTGALDPFLTGHIAMRIDGDWFMQTISTFRPDLRFGVVRSPLPAARRAAGAHSIGWCGGWAYAIPSTAKRKDGAWELLKWLCSLEANKMMNDIDASRQRAAGQVFFPRPHPDNRIMAWLSDHYVEQNPAISEDLRKAFRTFVGLLPDSKYRPVTPVGQKLWNEHVRATETAYNHAKTPYEALNYGKRRVQVALDRLLHPPTGPRVRWGVVVTIYLSIVALFLGTLIVVQERRRRLYGGRRGRWIEGYICASPWLVGFIVFGAGPIIFSLIISFCNYDVLHPARFIGPVNYVNLVGTHFDSVVNRVVANDPLFWKSLKNTFYMVIGVPLGIVVGLSLALLLNRKVGGMSFYRTVYYLPAVVPAVAAFILWIWVFDPGRGLLNQVLALCGVTNLPGWLQDPAWAKPALILMGLWGAGGGMIIWLAGLQDIPKSLYEAAAIDGANRWHQFRHVTLPLLTPYIFFNLIMGLIGVFQVFESAYIMTEGGPADATLFYAYKLFNEAFRYLNMGTASAMAWILFIVVLIITLLQLWLSKKWVHYGR